MNLISLTCPQCTGTLAVDPDKSEISCPYCGAKMLISEDKMHITIDIKKTIVDEAKLARVRFEEQSEQRRIEARERSVTREHKRRLAYVIVAFVWIIVCVIMSMIAVRLVRIRADAAIAVGIITYALITVPIFVLITIIILRRNESTYETVENSHLLGLIKTSHEREITASERARNLWVLYITFSLLFGSLFVLSME